MAENITFSHYHQGSINDPIPFSLQPTATIGLNDVQSFGGATESSEMTVVVLYAICPGYLSEHKCLRYRVSNVQTPAHEGKTPLWNGLSKTGSQLSSGVYIVRLETEQGIITRKVVLQR
jgi:hypothetical protein